MRSHEFTISDFICPKCNHKQSLPRKKGKQREKGHIKNIYCPFCKEKTQHVEIRAFDSELEIIGENHE